MTAVRTSKYYVSDCLSERHPYKACDGFSGQPSRDKGRVFDGFGDGGLDQLLRSLTDSSLDEEERAKAVHHLCAHAACQETKLYLLHRGVTALLVAVLRQEPRAVLEHQCYLLLRSLCTMCQGCYCALRDEAVQVAVETLRRAEASAERANVRAAASDFVCQLASNVAGRAWLLQLQSYDTMKLDDDDAAPSDGVVAPDVAVSLVACLTTLLQSEESHSVAALGAVRTLAALTAVAPGVRVCMGDAAFVSALTQHLRLCADAAVTTTPATTSFLAELLSVVWNVAMDQAGVELLECCGVVSELFNLFARVCRAGPSCTAAYPASVQRQLMGALSAVFKLTGVKLDSVGVGVAEFATRVHALLAYLRLINTVVDEARLRGDEVNADVVAMAKNTVQCLRLASEVRATRDVMHRYVDELAVECPTEVFYLRRQLYYGTRWEEEFDAHV